MVLDVVCKLVTRIKTKSNNDFLTLLDSPMILFVEAKVLDILGSIKVKHVPLRWNSSHEIVIYSLIKFEAYNVSKLLFLYGGNTYTLVMIV